MNLTTLRPTEATSAGITEALARARDMRVAVLDHVAAAKANRDALLLDGDAQQLAAAEKALTEARGDEERVEAIIIELNSRLTTTKKAETVTETRASLEASRAATDARRIWWERNGKKFTTMLREVTSLHVDQQDAVEDARRKQLRLADYDDHAEISAAMFAEVPATKDVDDATWRIFEKVSDAWQFCASLNSEKEAA